MKKAIIILIMSFGLCQLAAAQSRISDDSLVHDGSKAIVTFKVDTDDNSKPSKRKEIIMS